MSNECNVNSWRFKCLSSATYEQGILLDTLEEPKWAILDAWEAFYGSLPPVPDELEGGSPEFVNDFDPQLQYQATENEQIANHVDKVLEANQQGLWESQ